ncbi:uracil-DNA glycosylase [bacterium]|nr:MAG: uracil-DNA glycosylase [bacterium]
MKPEDEPYALRSPDEKTRRMKLLGQPHMEPLVRYLEDIKVEHHEKDPPHFDPCDGGINARVLFLLEAPGPKAVSSNFISRNNPDPTARNMCRFLQDAGIQRSDSVLWNIVPWYVGDGSRIRAVNNNDIIQAAPYLKELIALLPELKVIALVGKKAQSAQKYIRELSNLPLIHTHHPSARVFNVWPHKRKEMSEQLAEIAEIINGRESGQNL